MNTVGDRIRFYRKQANNGNGITQKELGEACGMYESQIRKYELGKANPKMETLQKIADALKVSMAELAPELLRIRSINDEVIHNMELLLKQLPEMDLPDEVKEMHRQTAIKEIEKCQEELERTNLFFISDAKQRKLLTDFSSLNDSGKRKAVEQVELLTKIPEYKNS